MARGPAVPIKGVWLRKEGDWTVVSIEAEDGQYIEIIRELSEGNFSHSVSEHGLKNALEFGHVNGVGVKL